MTGWKRAALAVRDGLWVAADRAVALCGRCGRRPPGGPVLVVRLDEIGDFVLWTDAAKDLRAVFPGRRIILAANVLWCELGRAMPWCDEVLPVAPHRLRCDPLYRARLLLRVRRLGCSTALHPTWSRRKHVVDGDSLIRASGAVERIGWADPDAPTWRGRLSDRAYTRLLAASPGPMPEPARNAAFMRALGAPDRPPARPRLTFAATRPRDFALSSYYVLVPGASQSFKRWPAERFAALAERLFGATGWTGVLCGSSAEAPLADRLRTLTSAPLSNWCGRTTVMELVAILRGARLTVSNDTGPVHLAAAVDVPVVCILGGGHFGRFLPYAPAEGGGRAPVTVVHDRPCFGCDWRCIYADRVPAGQAVPCVDGVSVDAVWQAVLGLMGELAPPGVAAGGAGATAKRVPGRETR